MCTPVDDANKPQQRGDGMGLAREDLDVAREAVIDEVRTGVGLTVRRGWG